MAWPRLEREGPGGDGAEPLERHPLGDRGEAVQDQPPLRCPVAQQARRREQPVPEPDPVEVDRHGRSMPRRPASLTRRRRAAGGAAPGGRRRGRRAQCRGHPEHDLGRPRGDDPAGLHERPCPARGVGSREHLADELEGRGVAARVLERPDDEVPLRSEVASSPASVPGAASPARHAPRAGSRAGPVRRGTAAGRPGSAAPAGSSRRGAGRTGRRGSRPGGSRRPGRTAPGSCRPRTPCARSARRWAAGRCRTGRAPPRTSRRRARGRTCRPSRGRGRSRPWRASTGWRNVFERTACPTRIPGTWWTSAASRVIASNEGPGVDRVHVGDVVVHPAAVERVGRRPRTARRRGARSRRGRARRRPGARS